MKLLIATQAVDRSDPSLGFFHRWIEEFAKHCESIEVICLYEGLHSLPANVRLHSLGKEKIESSTKEKSGMRKMFLSLLYASRFKLLAFKLRKEYDAVFVHMNPEYAILGSLVWHVWKKRIGLWYLHKSVDLKLRVAALLVDVIFSASPESFRLKSSKVRMVGHGIALDIPEEGKSVSQKISPEAETISTPGTHQLRLVTVGRISPAKNLDVLIDTVNALSAQDVPCIFDAIGTVGRPEEKPYEAALIKRAAGIAGKSAAHFLGPRTHAEVASLLPSYDLFLHASTGTGSVDKAVLEALLSGVPVVSSSPAFRELLSPYGLFAEKSTGEAIAEAVKRFLGRPDQESVRTMLRDKVASEYSLAGLIPRILSMLQ